MKPRSTHAHRPLSLKGRIWLGLGTVAVGGAVVTAAAFAGTPDTHSQAGYRGPIRPSLSHTPLTTLPGQAAGRVPSQGLAARSTSPFNMLGVSWDSVRTRLDGTVQVRTRSIATGAWSDWTTVGASDAAPGQAEPGTEGGRGATEPLWTGPADGVQVRVTPGAGARALPTGLRLELIGSGRFGTATGGTGMQPAAFAADVSGSPTGSASPTGTATATDTASPTGTAGSTATATSSPSATASSSTTAGSASPTGSPSPTVPPAPTSNVPKPTIVDRAGWGADETLREQTLPNYSPDGVKVVFVHHTTDSNDYVCSTDPTNPDGSAAVVQADYAYHVEVNGWRDIGYNFLVDKCGTLFEGRWGGLDNGGGEALPVIGAHTYGWNTNTMAVSVLGNYTSVSAPRAVLGSIAALADWKLGMYGIKANGTSQLRAGYTQTSYTGISYTAGSYYDFHAVSGHRDAYNTQCPGNDLYPQLGTIRTYATGPAAAPVITGFKGAAKSGTTWYTKGSATVSWSESWPSTVLRGFQVIVDGTVVAKPSRTARSASLTLSAGSHTVAVRAVHLEGGTSTSASAAVVGDTTRPVFSSAPSLRTRTGTVSSSAVPVTLAWKATDNASLHSTALTSPFARTFAATTTSYHTSAKPGVSTTWAMRATDTAGNYTTASVARTPVIMQEYSSTHTGTWTRRTSTSYLGGASYSSGSKGASITWSFTGRSVSWIVSRASSSGQAYVYVDGVKVATVDLQSSTTLYRQAIWTRTWSGSAGHQLKIVVVGTSGRPTITTDGIAVIK